MCAWNIVRINGIKYVRLLLYPKFNIKINTLFFLMVMITSFSSAVIGSCDTKRRFLFANDTINIKREKIIRQENTSGAKLLSFTFHNEQKSPKMHWTNKINSQTPNRKSFLDGASIKLCIVSGNFEEWSGEKEDSRKCCNMY